MDIRVENGLVTIESLRQLLVDHYINQSFCNWNEIIKINHNFGKSPLNGIRVYQDKPKSIKPLLKLLRKNGIPVLHINRDDHLTYTITLMSHSNEN